MAGGLGGAEGGLVGTIHVDRKDDREIGVGVLSAVAGTVRLGNLDEAPLAAPSADAEVVLGGVVDVLPEANLDDAVNGAGSGEGADRPTNGDDRDERGNDPVLH